MSIPKGFKPGPRLSVQDQAALTDVCMWLLERRAVWERKIKNPDMRIDRTALYRLIRDPRPTITQHTHTALASMLFVSAEAGVERDHLDALLERAVMGANANALVTAHLEWEQERAGRFMRRRGRRFDATERDLRELTPADCDGWTADDAGYRASLAYGFPPLQGIHAVRDAAYMKLTKHLERAGLWVPLRAFLEWAHANGHSSPRADLAILRILEPLLEAPESGFIERQWQELTDDEMRAFIRHGIAREKIMLRREPDAARAQAIVASGPRSLWAARRQPARRERRIPR